MLPDAVDHQSRGERIFRAGDGVGQFPSSTSLGKERPIIAGQNPEKTAWCQLTLIGGITTGKHFHVLNFALGDRVRNRIHRGRCLARCGQLIAQFLEFATTLFR